MRILIDMNLSPDWLAWGPYVWADGAKSRADGLTYLPEDLGPDGIHPSSSGREKVAELLLNFLTKDPSSHHWFLQPQIDGASVLQ